MAGQVPRIGGKRVRLELPEDVQSKLRVLGAADGLTVAAISRVAMCLVADGTLPIDPIITEARRLRAAGEPPEQLPKRPRGRPKKDK